jgi:hypothetical protein
VLAAAFALSAPAFSQPQASGGADDALRADEHFHKGQKLVDLGRLKEAREEYLTAFRLKRSYDVAGNLGSLELDLKLPRDAAEHLLFALHNYAASGTTPAQLAKAKERFAEVERQVGRIKVSVSVARADVFVDGKPVGLAPLGEDLFVDEGEHTIEARLAGYEPASQTIKIAKGAAQLVTLKLTPAAAMPLPVVSAVPLASAAPLASASASSAPPPPPSSSVPTPLVPSRGPNPAFIIASSVLAAGGVAAGIGFTVAANGKSGAADSLEAKVPGRSACTGAPGVALSADCKTLKSTVSEQSTMRNAAFVGFAAGGAFALVAVGLGVWRLKTPATTGVLHVSPVIGTREGGIVLGGAW